MNIPLGGWVQKVEVHVGTEQLGDYCFDELCCANEADLTHSFYKNT